jgi:formylglycine-generating enzyme required for sulfatase activity
VDFGAAKMASKTALAKTGTTIGSAGYAAPEQAFGKALYASDIYSLGVCCLHLLTDISPLTMYDPVEGFVWRDFLPDRQVANWLDDILEKMTQPNVRQRYQSASEILQTLQPSLQLQVSQSRSVSPAVGRSSSLSDSVSLDCGNGVMIELVRVAAGSFQMGSNGFFAGSAKPMHQVSLNDFWIGKYPVTQEQYFAVMGYNPSGFKGDQKPVEKVSWHNAMEFCQKLSQKTGHQLRLPTEAEWEYAAKGGNQSKGYQYAGSDNLNEVGWYAPSFWFVPLVGPILSGLFSLFYKTHSVGQKKANELGIYDMSGNVLEWCLDDWHGSYEGKFNQLKNNGNEPWGEMNLKNNNRLHPLRGGSSSHFAIVCRSTTRVFINARRRNSFAGFRLLLVSFL